MAITSRALAFVSRWFDPATVSRVFDPMIADWQRELLDTPPSRRVRVGVRGLSAFICAVLVSSPAVLMTRAPKSVTDRVAVRMTRFIALATFFIVTPMAMRLTQDGRYGMLLLAFLPSAITTVFPLSLIGAADAIRRSEPLAPNIERALALKLAGVSVLFMIVFGGFVVPAANQAFRVVQTEAGAPLMRNVRELTTWQLITDPTMAAPQEPYTGGAARATRIQRELNNRATLALIPVVLLWVRWRAIDIGRGKCWSPLPAPLATTIVVAAFLLTSFYGFFLERDLGLAAGTGHWLPIAAFAVWALTAAFRRRVMPPLDEVAADLRDRWRASRCP
jgi:hypothetical protein